MKEYLLKLKLLLPAHLVTTLGMVPVYGLIRYFTLVPLSPKLEYQFMAGVWGFVLPLLLPLVPLLSIFRYRLLGIVYRFDSDRGRYGISYLTYFTAVAVLLATSSYVTDRFGRLVEVSSPLELAEAPFGNFYTIEEFAIPRKWGTYFTDISTTGKGSKLNFHLLFASPFLSSPSDSVPESPEFWYGVRHSMSMSNRATKAKKDAALKAFQEASLKKMANWNFHKVTYFKRIPKSEDFFYYNRAIANRIRVNKQNQFVILEAVDEPFADRAGSSGAWIFYTWLIGTAGFLLFLLGGHPDLPIPSSRIRKFKKGSWVNISLSALQFSRGYVVTPIFLTIMLTMTVIMGFCGVLGGYLDNPDLAHWGALRRPEVTNGGWWRMLTYGLASTGPVLGLVHIGVFAFLGKRVEVIFGSRKTLTLLLVSLLSGAIFSMYAHPVYWVAGSSPMVLAYCVGFLMTLSFRKNPFPTGRFVACLGYVLFAFTLGFLDYMDHFANLGAIIGSLSVLLSSGKTRSRA
ncbi:hypothetical protein GCM10009119_05170 [Algoriphagus jejuensis]|uniref:Peptidase S54 rhomboid domain-containing protein n=1 Tax=Algoriphagus jejuensis TaxID=419934 RepID=A0ABN1MVY5_9BACT